MADRRLWPRSPSVRGGRLRSGWLTLVVALSPPLDGWSDRWLSAHMVQHELLMIIAAPLIALGAPMVAILWAMPSGARHRTIESFVAGRSRPRGRL